MVSHSLKSVGRDLCFLKSTQRCQAGPANVKFSNSTASACRPNPKPETLNPKPPGFRVSGPSSWPAVNMSYSLNSLKGGCIGDLYRGLLLGVIKGDTRSLDYSSHGGLQMPSLEIWGPIRFESFFRTSRISVQFHHLLSSKQELVPPRFPQVVSRLSTCRPVAMHITGKAVEFPSIRPLQQVMPKP